ncbi:hypothetical protein [Enterococcus thailandicus]|uniref:hypothetical protein n=1 Tax=Enterococcus thailandicus TaxID=417368 RepID=UPI001E437BB1|nr:hypothetical protein [Enterococcus thailandicus]
MIALGKIDNRESTDKEIPEAIKKFLYLGIAISKNEKHVAKIFLKILATCFWLAILSEWESKFFFWLYFLIFQPNSFLLLDVL